MGSGQLAAIKKLGSDAPAIPIIELRVQKDSVVTFFGRKHFLSNFYQSPFVINGHTYPTVEHYYEACKVFALAGSDYARSLKGIADPGQTKAQARLLVSHLPRKVVDSWRFADGVIVIKAAVREKFKQSRALTEELLKTGDKLLVQANKFEAFWGVGLDEAEFLAWLEEAPEEIVVRCPQEVTAWNASQFGLIGKGRNLLGHVIMAVRQQVVADLAVAAELTALRLTSVEQQGKEGEEGAVVEPIGSGRKKAKE